MTNISVSFGQVKKILHLADIHIRLFKRHDEYKECFKRLYADLHAHIEEGTVIVVAGDIVHSKTDMSPELVNLASMFLKQLASLAPTIVIAGNHDLNMANKNRLDALSPIVDSIKHHNLHYLKDSGVYRCADVDFAVLSIIGDRTAWPTPDQCTARTKIALFHDAVFGATTDVGFSVQKQSMTVEDFAGYDIVLLGDIHRHQVLQEANPIIVYPGSLIQQNHGESLKGHGWCEWDVVTRTFKFHELHNEYGFCTLEITNQVDDTLLETVPAKPYLRVFTRGLDHSQVKLLEAFYRTQKDVREWSHTPLDGMRKNVNTDALGNIIDITNVDLQNTLIRNYLKEVKPDISEKLIERILELNTEANEQVASEDMARKIVWRPLSLKFDNLFTFGDSNSINFTALHDIVGIFAPNATGKTSIAEAICFALYDKTPRAIKAANIMNTRSDKCYLEFRFEIEGVEYVVERRGTKNKKGEVKIDVDFYRLEDGDRISLNGSERRYTNENIRQYVGDFEEFLLTTFSSSSQQGLFVDRGQAERKNLLGQFLGLKIFDDLFEYAKRESKDLEAQVNQFRKDSTAEDLVVLEELIALSKINQRDADTALEVTNGQLNAITASIQELLVQKIPLGEQLNLNKLESELQYHTDNAQADEEHTKLLRDKAGRLQEQLQLGEAKLIEYEGVEKDYQTHISLKTKLSSVVEKLKNDLRSWDAIRRTLVKLREHEFDPNCAKCVKNASQTIQSITEAEESLVETNLTVEIDQALQDSLMTDMKVYMGIDEKYTKLLAGRKWIQDTKIEIPKLEAEIAKLETTIEVSRNAIERVEGRISDYYMHSESIFKNEKIDEIVGKLEAEKTVLKRTFSQQQTACRDVAVKLAVATQKYDALLKKIEETHELEAQYEAYKLYLDVVSKDGLSYKMIAEILPSLQISVNNVLSQMVDFRLEFEAENQNINIRLIYDENQSWSLDLASGMEKFVSSLAIRVALAQISALPKSTFLILDEGLGTLDAEKLGQMYGVFDVLRTQFDFVMLITHIDAAKDVADQLVEIQRNDGFSRIVVE